MVRGGKTHLTLGTLPGSLKINVENVDVITILALVQLGYIE